jgi:hypothetical protein
MRIKIHFLLRPAVCNILDLREPINSRGLLGLKIPASDFRFCEEAFSKQILPCRCQMPIANAHKEGLRPAFSVMFTVESTAFR